MLNSTVFILFIAENWFPIKIFLQTIRANLFVRPNCRQGKSKAGTDGIDILSTWYELSTSQIQPSLEFWITNWYEHIYWYVLKLHSPSIIEPNLVIHAKDNMRFFSQVCVCVTSSQRFNGNETPKVRHGQVNFLLER